MEIFVISFLIVCLAVLGLAVGVICGKRPLISGCGGKNFDPPDGAVCGVCGGDLRDVGISTK